MGSAALSPGIAVTPLGGAHATNVNDIIAIGKKRWEQPFRPAAAATAAPASKEARVLKNFGHCFANGGRRIAATYPQVDAQSGAVVTLEDAINECLALHGEPALDTAKPSDALMLGALSAYVRSLAVGQKLNIRVANAAARAQYLAGREWFTRRIGDKNLACASCHAVDAGKTLEEAGRTRVLSPVIGQVLAWPRVEPGGGVRLLQHQFQRCMVRAGAEPFAFGSQEFNQLEYFLSAMSNGLTVRPAMPTD
jgi:sulfur-oxidizing protein SoxA